MSLRPYTIVCALTVVAMLGLVASCSKSSSSGDGAPATLAACFQGGTAPELQIGSGFANADWNDPHVLKVGAEYWMYASSNLGLFNPPTPPSPVQIYRFTSTDATTWTLSPTTPVLAVTNGQWDQGGNETPAVVSFKGKYHMFWTGYPDAWPNLVATNFHIGHATSTDGIAWTKDAAPLLSPSGTGFMQSIVGEPGPVVFNNTLYLYFTAFGPDSTVTPANLQVVGVMTFDDVAWSAPALAFKPDQTVYPRASNWVGYSTPNAVVIDGKVHVFVDVANNHGNNTWIQEALHHAYSSDGLTGWTQDAAPIRRLTDFTWTKREIRSPGAFLDGTTLRLYFAGDDVLAHPTAWGIGQMTCSLAP